MAAMSRNKGKVGEREIAALIAGATGWHVRRRVRQHEGDSDLEGVPGWCVEVKRHATASAGELAAWWAQAVAQAERAGELPLLLYRADRAAWRAVWPLSVTLTQQRPDYWRGFEWTVNTSIEAWAAVARETAAGDREVKLGQGIGQAFGPARVRCPRLVPHEAKRTNPDAASRR